MPDPRSAYPEEGNMTFDDNLLPPAGGEDPPADERAMQEAMAKVTGA
jgi:hypothetical protein